MTKKVKISILILVWSIVAVQIYVNDWEYKKNEKGAVTAFSVVEDDITEEWIRGYGHFGTMELSEKSKQEMLQNLAYKLGITEGYIADSETGEDYKKVVLTKKGKYADTTIQIISLPGREEADEQYIVMDIQTREGISGAVGIYQKVKRIYEEIGVNAQVGIEVQIEKKGDYISGRRDILIRDIFKLIKAKEVDSIKKNDIYTVYGYTRLEDSYLTLNEKKVNVQVVISYAENEDKTYVKVGVPMVNSSY